MPYRAPIGPVFGDCGHIKKNGKSSYGTTHSGYGTTPVGWGGGNRYVEGDLLTFGYLMLNDSLGYPYYRLINVG